MNDEGKQYPNRTVEGRTELVLVQDEVDEGKRLLEEAHVEVQAAQNRVIEAAFQVGRALEEMARIKKLLEANSEPAGQEEASVGKRQEEKKPCGKNGVRPSWRKLQDIRIQCVDFCEATTSKVHAVLQHAPFDLQGDLSTTPTCSGGNC